MMKNTQIWLYDPRKSGEKLSAVSCFRRKFNCSGGTLTVRGAALGIYDLQVDGRPLTDDLFLAGWSDNRVRAEYRTFTCDLSAGEHEIRFFLADGWYAGFVGGADPVIPHLYAELLLPDGQRISADASWECASDGPWLYSDIYMGEYFDFNRTFTDFYPAGLAEKQLALEPFEGESVRRIRKIKPLSIQGNIVDFGENLTGWAVLKFQASRGTVITLRHAEVLDGNGALYTKNLRAAKATGTVVASGNMDIYEPRFTFYGFRYCEVSGAEDFEIEAYSIHSDMPLHLDFDCSDPLLNKLAANIRRGWLCNALDVPTDCPQRDERTGWLGDAQVFIKAALYLSDCSKFFRRWLKNVRSGCDAAGKYPIVAPFLKRFGAVNAAGWADAGVICPWQLYCFTGQKEILEENYPAMLKFIRARWQDFRQGAVPPADFGDWLNADDPTDEKILGTAFMAYSAQLVLNAAQVLQDQAAISELTDYLKKIKKYFAENFSERLTSQTALVLALEFDLLPPDQRQKAAEKLVQRITVDHKMHLSTGFLGTPHLLHALSNNGHTDIAWQLLEQKTCPSWLFPVLHGATTVWEHWDSWTPEKGFQDPVMNSFNHYAYGAVLDWIIGVAVGIRPDFTLDPHPGGSLSYMEACYRGLKLRWEKANGRIRYTIHVPAGIKAAFRGKPLQDNMTHYFEENLK